MVAAKFVIVEPRMLQKTLAAAKICDIPKSNIFTFDTHESFSNPEVRSWACLLEHGEADFVPCLDPDTTIAAYQTSSGTSGLPKAAMIPHSYLKIQAVLRLTDAAITYEVRRLTALPPMHVFATPIVPASIRQGHATYIMRRYDLAEYLEAIERYKVTETWLPPPPLIAIPKSDLATKKGLQSLRQIWMGGAGVTYQNQLPLYALLHPDARINQVWGMTEVGWVTQVHWPKKQEDNSVGTTLRGHQVRVVDNNGLVSREKESLGELQILAPHPMLGYLNNAKATQEAFTVDAEGQWVNSGDIGFVDAGGNVFIIDRKKDLIKVRGWQVSPAEVEGCLQEHPDVVDVGVIGLPLPNGEGEYVRAYVVRKQNSLVTQDGLQRFAMLTLTKYKCPEEIIFTDSIPRNPTGKILRRILRERTESEVLPPIQPAYKHVNLMVFSSLVAVSVLGIAWKRGLRQVLW